MSEETKNQLANLLNKTTLPTETKGLITEFFSTIENESQYEKIVDLLVRFPTLFDNFCRCFEVKSKFLQKGGDKKDWLAFVAKEKNLFE